MHPYDYITERQKYWAWRHGILIGEAGYVEELNDNFFLPPTDEMLRELPRDGAGNPHNDLYAVHSSAALVVNVLAYWRLYNKLGSIISVLCPDLVGHDAEKLTFEAQCPIGWPPPPPGRQPPQLDVVITYRDKTEPSVLKAVGVESKFRELYRQDQGDFVDCYVAPENACIWEGCEPLYKLAVKINQGEKNIYGRLKVAQLIKHILGMKSQFHGTENIELVYLWYPAPGADAVKHEEEIRRFQQLTNECQPRIRFRAIAYPDLIHSLAAQQGTVHGAYVDYLTERYF